MVKSLIDSLSKGRQEVLSKKMEVCLGDSVPLESNLREGGWEVTLNRMLNRKQELPNFRRRIKTHQILKMGIFLGGKTPTINKRGLASLASGWELL